MPVAASSRSGDRATHASAHREFVVFLAFQGQVEHVPRVLGTLIGLVVLVCGVALIKLAEPSTDRSWT